VRLSKMAAVGSALRPSATRRMARRSWTMASKHPAAGLLIDHLPGGKVLGQVTPRRAAARHPTEGVEDVAEAVDALSGVLGQEAEIGPDELPLGVGDVTRVRLVSDHALNYAGDRTKVHNTL
jgi:hypothetical protein